jgi:hypothetical protein
MKPDLPERQLTRGEQETETEAARLIEHIKEALSAVAVRSTDEADSLDALADRIERAARDLSAALRELAAQRRIAEDVMEQ